jgi:excisionase family DNA binding protein
MLQPRGVEPIAVSTLEAAAALGVCRATIYNLMSSGKLRTAKVLGRRLVPLAELQRLLTESGEAN